MQTIKGKVNSTMHRVQILLHMNIIPQPVKYKNKLLSNSNQSKNVNESSESMKTVKRKSSILTANQILLSTGNLTRIKTNKNF